MTPEALKELQILRTRIQGTCATVRLVCESPEITYAGAMLNAEVVERMVRELIYMINEFEDQEGEEEHIAALRALLDELDAAEQMLGQKVHELARTAFGI